MLAVVNWCGCASGSNSPTCGLAKAPTLNIYVPRDFFCCKEIQEIVCRAKRLILDKYKEIANEVANSIVATGAAELENNILLIRAVCKALETYKLPTHVVEMLTAKLKRLTTLLNC